MRCSHGTLERRFRCKECDDRFAATGVVCSEGQLKKGDKIHIVGKSESDSQNISVKEVLDVDGREEILINISRNRYFITEMLLDGKSWANQVRLRK